MAFPRQQYQNLLQQQSQLQKSQPFTDIYNSMDDQIHPQVEFLNGPNLPDQSHHPPYIPPFQLMELAPGRAEDGGLDLEWDCRSELNRKRPKEQDFLAINSQISSLDFLQARSVSTGLGLSLDNGRLASSGDSALLGLVGDDIELELQRQEAEIVRFVKVQGDQLKQAILEKVQANQLRTISYIEEKVRQRFQDKDAELADVNKKNMELELRVEQLVLEADAWQQRARYNENLINTLKYNLQQVYAQSRDSKEGCGDSEVDDTASYCNGRAIDFQLLRRDGSEMKDVMTCKVCRVNRVCMLLLPCKHLCLCKECESKFSFCPLCNIPKVTSAQIYM